MASNPSEIKGTSIHLIAQMTAKPGQAEAILKHLKNVQVNAHSDNEPGCNRYDVVRYEDHFAVIENYSTQGDVDIHMASEQFKAFAAEVESLTVPGTFILKFFGET
ncbi:hypothetical protein DACRYDRAFT_21402 [Dacryopinax primogenitus]|uniref:ABM domain-containing protein n=1 Tax=Dacryopinax primogenitus (strain DJM 731) TaxID=1858805 RepID=M5G4B6_DACPD|nr:uncharacterized protein DACRYDRAFT_21402 [Dacryopinax primogenitus]EJU03070.1 hypothetical protein DACRYDRAFT_21402 [Dacryopinax primogenitus]